MRPKMKKTQKYTLNYIEYYFPDKIIIKLVKIQSMILKLSRDDLKTNYIEYISHVRLSLSIIII